MNELHQSLFILIGTLALDDLEVISLNEVQNSVESLLLLNPVALTSTALKVLVNHIFLQADYDVLLSKILQQSAP